MSMKLAHLPVIALAFLTGGCNSDDPNQGGLFGGLIGLGSGSYEQRVADREAEWAEEEAAYQAEVAAKGDLDQDLEARRQSASALDQDIATLEQSVIDLND